MEQGTRRSRRGIVVGTLLLVIAVIVLIVRGCDEGADPTSTEPEAVRDTPRAVVRDRPGPRTGVLTNEGQEQPAESTPASTPSVFVRVLDVEGNRVAGARVLGRSESTGFEESGVTDADGVLHFDDRLPQDVLVRADGFATTTHPVRLRADGPTDVILIRSRTVRGRLVDFEGRPVSEALTVVAWPFTVHYETARPHDPTDPRVLRTRANANGVFVIEGLPSGTCSIIAFGGPWCSRVGRPPHIPAGATEVDVPVDPILVLAYDVVDGSRPDVPLEQLADRVGGSMRVFGRQGNARQMHRPRVAALLGLESLFEGHPLRASEPRMQRTMYRGLPSDIESGPLVSGLVTALGYLPRKFELRAHAANGVDTPVHRIALDRASTFGEPFGEVVFEIDTSRVTAEVRDGWRRVCKDEYWRFYLALRSLEMRPDKTLTFGTAVTRPGAGREIGRVPVGQYRAHVSSRGPNGAIELASRDVEIRADQVASIRATVGPSAHVTIRLPELPADEPAQEAYWVQVFTARDGGAPVDGKRLRSHSLRLPSAPFEIPFVPPGTYRFKGTWDGVAYDFTEVIEAARTYEFDLSGR